MCGGSPAAPTPPPKVPEAPITPEVGVTRVDQDMRRRRAAAGNGGGRSTILTSARGVQDGAAIAQKTLLGQ